MQFSKLLSLAFILLFSLYGMAQTKSQKAEITKNYDQVKLAQMAEEFNIQETAELEKALEMAKINNWPLTYTDENGTYYALMKVSETNKPIYYKTFNKNAARSTRANFMHNGGGLGLDIEGQNMIAHVWDGGIARPTHVEFSDAGGGASRIILGDTDADEHEHATHVTGTIIAYGANANAKGMAPQATAISYDWFGDLTEATIASSDGMLISNHSYGSNLADVNDWAIGAYVMESRAWDKIMYQTPHYLMVHAAGNDGDDNSSNGDPLDGNALYDKLDGRTVCKNNLVVANGYDLSVDSNGNIVGNPNLDSSSSEGPTDDYRVKPDITGNGTSVYSCTSASNTSYASWYGTSMASPNVAGSLLLLHQYYNEKNGNFMLSSTLRGLALHNADDGGLVGPDAHFGWGYLNTKKAAECIMNDGTTAEVEEMIMNDGESFTFDVVADGTQPLIASICWTDRHSDNINTGTANDTTPVLVNDLDIRVTKSSTTYEPWKLTGVDSNTTGDNIVDNFERIDIAGATGTYTVTITHKGTLFDGLQAFAVVVSGIVSSNLGIDSEKISNLKIWPNPNKGKFNIFVESNEKVTVTVSDVLGKIVHNETYSNDNTYIKSIDVDNLTNGVYIINVLSEGKKLTNKLIIE